MRLAKPHLHPKRDMHDISGIEIPDSKLVREITELVRDTEPLLLFHHSSRVYYKRGADDRPILERLMVSFDFGDIRAAAGAEGKQSCSA